MEIAASAPRPGCYGNMDNLREWVPGFVQMMDDLYRLANDDGCIAAGWAVVLIECWGAELLGSLRDDIANMIDDGRVDPEDRP